MLESRDMDGQTREGERAGAKESMGMRDIEGKVAREAMSERSRGDASDIDGQTERSKMGGST